MVRITTSNETSSDTRSGERVARNPTSKPTPNKISRIFVTVNYKDPQLTPLENETKMHAEFEQMKTILEENLLFMSLASGWEEYGEERNAHIHLSSKQTPKTVSVSPSGKPPSENNSKSPSIHILTWSQRTVQTNKSSTTDSKKEKQPNGQHAAKLKQTLGFFFSAQTMTPQKTIADRELIFSTLCAIAPTSTNLWQNIQILLVKDSQLSVVITTSSTP